MGIRAASPTPLELPLSNRTWFSSPSKMRHNTKRAESTQGEIALSKRRRPDPAFVHRVAGDAVMELRRLAPAALVRERAARMEGAARWRMDRVRGFAFDGKAGPSRQRRGPARRRAAC